MHHNTCCLCGIQPQVKGRAQSLIKQDSEKSQFTRHTQRLSCGTICKIYTMAFWVVAYSTSLNIWLLSHCRGMPSWKAPAYNTNYFLTSLVLQECLGAFIWSQSWEVARAGWAAPLQPLLSFSGQEGQEWASTKGLQEPPPQSAAGLPPPH